MSAQLRQLVRSNLSTTKSCISLESTIATAKEKLETNAKRQQTLQEALTGAENIADEVEKKKEEVEEKKYEMEMNENAVSAKQSTLSELDSKMQSADDRTHQI